MMQSQAIFVRSMVQPTTLWNPKDPDMSCPISGLSLYNSMAPGFKGHQSYEPSGGVDPDP